MHILSVYDRTRSLRATAAECGCSHHTVKRYVRRRQQGLAGEPVKRPRPSVIDPHRPLIEELVQASGGRVRADVCHRKLQKVGYAGSERTTRRAVAKHAFKQQNRRIFRPWITEPGKWAQYDWARGPTIAGRESSLFCAWLAWSRFRVVIPTMDRRLETLIGCLSETQSCFGGVPSHWLTDNERTVCRERVANLPVKHPAMVAFARHCGPQLELCEVADPQAKGGSESTVKIAKADLVPTDANLLPGYASFGQLIDACDEFLVRINSRAHSITGQAPLAMLEEERRSLHPLPKKVFSIALGQSRRVSETAMVAWRGAWYSVPHELVGESVLVRENGDAVIVVTATNRVAREVARHRRAGRGQRVVNDSHYPKAPPGPLNRRPRPRNASEREFLAIGPGAEFWLRAATAAGSARLRDKLEEIVQLARLQGREKVNAALGMAATAERFGFGDIAAIAVAGPSGPLFCAGQDKFLQRGTSAWRDFGATSKGDGR